MRGGIAAGGRGAAGGAVPARAGGGAAGANTQLGLPLLSTSSAIMRLIQNEAADLDRAMQQRQDAQPHLELLELHHVGACAPGALANETSFASSSSSGRSENLTGPAIFKSRPVECLTSAMRRAFVGVGRDEERRGERGGDDQNDERRQRDEQFLHQRPPWSDPGRRTGGSDDPLLLCSMSKDLIHYALPLGPGQC